MKKFFLLLLSTTLFFFSCKKINIYEKLVAVPGFKWEKSFKPTFTFENNSSSSNTIYAIIRHTNNYPYNNIWVRLTATSPKDSSIVKNINIPLTRNNQNKEWANKGMDDIYEIRHEISPFAGAIGEYTFTLENIMRDDPLPEVLNVGLRIAKDK